jgi:SGNH domain (fused to AT3 domains)
MSVATRRGVLVATLFVLATSLAGSSVQPVFGAAGPQASPATTGPDADGDGLTDPFETANGLNPDAADSDGNGLQDPAEDLDRDGLSNLAEQKLGTDPRISDTDGDGTLDGDDDANGNGTADWVQQDARPVPDNLIPSLANANSDSSCYKPGVGSTGKCNGDPKGTITIAIYGDSHAGQWIPALDTYAKSHQWRLRNIAKSGCPSIHIATTTDGAFNAECRQWRSDSEAQLRAAPPDLVIVANSTHYPAPRDMWRHGLKELLSALPTSRVLLLDDTAFFPHRVPSCLSSHPNNIGGCEVPRSSAYRPKYKAVALEVAKETGVAFASMNPWVCPYALCPVIVNHFLMWRDNNHLTVTYSRQLAPAFGRLVTIALHNRP